ncbi:MAG: hypothetical protein HY308_07350 [Gammaproteobacteria bacterium]|nr:hypothetical protein [Gammaproteobacteria bacterium]
MNALKARFKETADRIDAMSVRERGMIFFAVVVVLALIAYNVVFGPLRLEQRKLERDIKAKQAEIHSTDQQVATMFGDGKDVNSQNRTKITALTQQLQELDSQMDQMTAGVVSPKEMAKLIEQMLTRNKHLELVKLEALPATPVDDGAAPATAGNNALPATDVTVYRHGMRVEFKGGYFDIVEYLKTLEGLPWKVFWGEVKLEPDKHPVSKVSLVIYTLSRHPGWIGL